MRQPALFSPDAGFHPRSITLTVDPAATHLYDAMAYWNRLARRDLFIYSSPYLIGTVGMDRCSDGAGGCAEIWPDVDQPYTKAAVALLPHIVSDPSAYLQPIAHELGHCLGLQHQFTGEGGSGKGVMGGSASRRKDRKFDRKLLKEAGYR